ncbi:MAG TPA: BON domain-containing protein [Candidatus Binataceae bacterium]|nr:BON domain-containing protein [Candidatus Binataceae bacterium]
MKNTASLNFVVPMLVLTLAAAGPVFAQSASESMHQAGESSENAASSAGHAISEAYHGTATAVKDSAITAKVKTALHDDKITQSGDIHVTTVAGVVTLRGTVASSDIADHAQQLAEQTTGVKRVKNKLKIATAGNAAN